MEKEKLSADLKGLVGENSLSERTWSDYLENNVVPFVPEEEDKRGDFLKRHANALKSLNGQLNYEVANKVNDFKKNYKPETTLPNNDQAKQPEPNRLEELETRLSKFEQAEEKKRQAAVKANKLDEAKKLMKDQGASNDTVLRLILPQLDVTEEVSTVDLVKQGKELYDKTYTDLYGESYVPAYGTGFSGANKKHCQDAYMKHLIETGRITK